MIEGGGSKTWNKAKKWLYLCPEESRKLLTGIYWNASRSDFCGSAVGRVTGLRCTIAIVPRSDPRERIDPY